MSHLFTCGTVARCPHDRGSHAHQHQGEAEPAAGDTPPQPADTAAAHEITHTVNDCHRAEPSATKCVGQEFVLTHCR